MKFKRRFTGIAASFAAVWLLSGCGLIPIQRGSVAAPSIEQWREIQAGGVPFDRLCNLVDEVMSKKFVRILVDRNRGHAFIEGQEEFTEEWVTLGTPDLLKVSVKITKNPVILKLRMQAETLQDDQWVPAELTKKDKILFDEIIQNIRYRL